MAKAKRVLHVTECYAGGVSKAMETLVGLTEDIDHHLVWSGDEVPDPTRGYQSLERMPATPWAAVAAIRRAVDRVKPDVVHAHSSWAGVFTRVRDLNTPVLYEPHCYKFDDPGQPRLVRFAYRMAEKILMPRAERTIVLSPHEEQLAQSLGQNVPTHFLPNAASILPTSDHLATGFQTDQTVLMIGRLSPQKDPDFFAEMARHARDALDGANFVWVGDGDSQARRRLERAGVEVTGWLSTEEMAATLARPSLYFHTARYEGFPLSILDAAAFEHPVAARHIPAFDRIGIPSASTPQDSVQLVSRIFNDPEVHNAAVTAARSLNERMSPEAQRRALKDLYNSSIRRALPNERAQQPTCS